MRSLILFSLLGILLQLPVFGEESGKKVRQTPEPTPPALPSNHPLANSDSTDTLATKGLPGAERELSTVLTGEDLRRYAVRGIDPYAALQPGVIRQDGDNYILGSDFYETGYYLEGTYLTNITSGRNGIYVIPEALETLTIGGLPFDAGFSGATGGAIRARLKTGGEKLQAAVFHRSDDFAGEGKQFLGTYAYGDRATAATLGGPLLSPRIRFFLAGEYHPTRDRAMRFVQGFTMNNLIDGNPENPKVLSGNPDTIDVLTYPEGNTPQNGQDRYSLNANITLNTAPVSARLDFAYWKNRDELNDTPLINSLNERKAFNDLQTIFLSAAADYQVAANQNIGVKFSLFDSFLEREDDFFGGNYRLWYDSTANAEKGIQFRSLWRPDYDYLLSGFPFQRNGTPYENLYFKSKLNFWEISGAYSLTLQGAHHLQVGAYHRKYQRRFFSIRPSVMFLTGRDKNPQNVNPILWNSFGNVIAAGYDIYGNEIAGSGLDSPTEPQNTAFYARDEFRWKQVSLALGFRYESLETDHWRLKDPANVLIDPQTGEILPENFEKTPGVSRLLPRLKFTVYPLSAMSLHIGYGSFLQFNRSYYPETFSLSTTGAVSFPSDVIRSNQVEIGLNAHIRDIADLGVQYNQKNTKGSNTTFNSFTGADGVDALDFHIVSFQVNSKRVKDFLASVHYTFTDADERFAGYLQKHRGALAVDYYYDRPQKQSFWEGSGAGLVYSFNSGHPYPYLPTGYFGSGTAYSAGVVAYTNPFLLASTGGNYDTTPWNQRVDLKVYKRFPLGRALALNIGLNVINLFNRKNVMNVYYTTGNAEYDGFFNNTSSPPWNAYVAAYGENFIKLYENINLKNGEAYRDVLGKELWGTPRQILLEVGLNFR